MFDPPKFESEGFCGRARLFPLPSVVMFPHGVQPLHIFEPRYREMMEDALEHDHLIAMALLASGWEEDYEGRPALHPIACLGSIVTHQRLPDGRYNLLLMGVRRVRIVRELPPERLFREAEVDLLEDQVPAVPAMPLAALKRQLTETFKRQLAQAGVNQEPLLRALEKDAPLGVLTDMLAGVVDLGLAVKTRLLDELDVERRAVLLLEVLKTVVPAKQAQPRRLWNYGTGFSEN